MINPNELLRAAALGGSMFMVLQLTAAMRSELEQLAGLVEAGMSECEEIDAANPQRVERAMHIGRAILDLVAANGRKLHAVEAQILLRRAQPPLPLFDVVDPVARCGRAALPGLP